MRKRSSGAALLGQVLEPLGRCLTERSAREILSLRSSDAVRRRLGRLAAKCDAGTLTPEEHAEYQIFVEIGDFVALLQAKARCYLAERRTA